MTAPRTRRRPRRRPAVPGSATPGPTAPTRASANAAPAAKPGTPGPTPARPTPAQLGPPPLRPAVTANLPGPATISAPESAPDAAQAPAARRPSPLQPDTGVTPEDVSDPRAWLSRPPAPAPRPALLGLEAGDRPDHPGGRAGRASRSATTVLRRVSCAHGADRPLRPGAAPRSRSGHCGAHQGRLPGTPHSPPRRAPAARSAPAAGCALPIGIGTGGGAEPCGERLALQRQLPGSRRQRPARPAPAAAWASGEPGAGRRVGGGDRPGRSARVRRRSPAPRLAPIGARPSARSAAAPAPPAAEPLR